MPAKPAATVKPSNPFGGLKSRPAAYRVAASARVVDIPECPGSSVARGVRVNGGEGAPESLVHIDGTRMTGLPLPVIAHAIIGGVITPAELSALVALRDAK